MSSATIDIATKFHLSLNINQLDASIAFLTAMLGCPPKTRHADYAKFEPDDVPLVLSLDAAYLDVPSSTPELPGVAPGFMLSQTMRRVIRKIKDTAGRPIWTPSYDAGIGGGNTTPDMLMGYPVYINNDLAEPAANAKSMAFGNFSRYLIRDAMDITFFRFDDSAYAKLGQVGFLAWARTGGNLLDANSVKVYQHSAT